MNQKQAAPEAIIITLAGDVRDEDVVALKFGIDGCPHVFGVHRTIGTDEDLAHWTATHAETGFAVARGDEINETIEQARKVWQSKKPEEIEAAIQSAHVKRRFGMIADIANG